MLSKYLETMQGGLRIAPIDNDLNVAQLGKPSSEISEQAKK